MIEIKYDIQYDRVPTEVSRGIEPWVSKSGTATDTHDISCDKGQDTYHEAETFHDRIVIISMG